MKTTRFLKQMPSLLLISGALVFSSCDNTNRTDRGTLGNDRDNVGTTDRAVDTYEMTDEDFNNRRDRVSANLDNEIARTRTDIEVLRERANNANAEESEHLQQQIERMEARVENLENQKARMEQSGRDNWDETERDIETTIHDREGAYDNIDRTGQQFEDSRTGAGRDIETGGNTQNSPQTPTDTRRDIETNVEGTDRTGSEVERTDSDETERGSGTVY